MKKIFLLLMVQHMAAGPLFAAGLSTSFVDVLVVDVPLGQAHRVEDRQGKGIRLRNTGNTALEVSVRAIPPAPEELRGGAKAIPDTQWIRIHPPLILVPAQEEVELDVVLEIPDQKRFRNRLYQSMIRMETKPPQSAGIQIRGALKSRLRFKTR